MLNIGSLHFGGQHREHGKHPLEQDVYFYYYCSMTSHSVNVAYCPFSIVQVVCKFTILGYGM
ncbi:hypothetical protein SLEP1_g39493 [Rubroshorea leprosula]|uniref:Uncharacterized protein n=1 Tax=Rubroshorea leprosula TaxID=152421 RepID=A0AAV5L0R8_9ROSI|nr:hypothetical protein SLEP1_g39493 [Rubroshorea leprosula]